MLLLFPWQGWQDCCCFREWVHAVEAVDELDGSVGGDGWLDLPRHRGFDEVEVLPFPLAAVVGPEGGDDEFVPEWRVGYLWSWELMCCYKVNREKITN